LCELPKGLVDIKIAHPRQLRAPVSGPPKTDKVDATLLAKFLKAKLIPEAYTPPNRYRDLRVLTRARGRLVQRMTQPKNELSTLLVQRNLSPP
jgi:hypothetical protein